MKNKLSTILSLTILTLVLISCSSYTKSETQYQDQSPSSSTLKSGSTSKFAIFDTPPVVIKPVRPVFPEAAKKRELEGRVFLQVEVLVDGSVGNVEILSSTNKIFEANAINAVRQFVFEPAKRSGKNVAVWINLPIEFNLNK